MLKIRRPSNIMLSRALTESSNLKLDARMALELIGLRITMKELAEKALKKQHFLSRVLDSEAIPVLNHGPAITKGNHLLIVRHC
jgi:hypothetical protein